MPPPFWVLGLLVAAGGTKPGLGQTGREVSWDPDWSADWLCHPLLQMALSAHPVPDRMSSSGFQPLPPFWVKGSSQSPRLDQRPWLRGSGYHWFLRIKPQAGLVNSLGCYLPKASCCRHRGPKTSRRDRRRRGEPPCLPGAAYPRLLPAGGGKGDEVYICAPEYDLFSDTVNIQLSLRRKLRHTDPLRPLCQSKLKPTPSSSE